MNGERAAYAAAGAAVAALAAWGAATIVNGYRELRSLRKEWEETEAELILLEKQAGITD